MKLSSQDSTLLSRWVTLLVLLDFQVVNFRALERPKEDSFYLERSKLHSYDDVVERVANYLRVDDPSKIRLTPNNCYSQQPKPFPIRYRGVGHLLEMLFHHNQCWIFLSQTSTHRPEETEEFAALRLKTLSRALDNGEYTDGRSPQRPRNHKRKPHEGSFWGHKVDGVMTRKSPDESCRGVDM